MSKAGKLPGSTKNDLLNPGFSLFSLRAFVVKKMPIIQVDHLTKENRLDAMQGFKQMLFMTQRMPFKA